MRNDDLYWPLQVTTTHLPSALPSATIDLLDLEAE